MGNMDEIRGGEAEFREPSPPESVIMGGEVEHRRPGPPGASPEEEARHEARTKSEAAHIVLLLPAGEPPPAPDEAHERRFQELMRVETVPRRADPETEELVAQLGIALWLNKPARRKAAA